MTERAMPIGFVEKDDFIEVERMTAAVIENLEVTWGSMHEIKPQTALEMGRDYISRRKNYLEIGLNYAYRGSDTDAIIDIHQTLRSTNNALIRIDEGDTTATSQFFSELAQERLAQAILIKNWNSERNHVQDLLHRGVGLLKLATVFGETPPSTDKEVTS